MPNAPAQTSPFATHVRDLATAYGAYHEANRKEEGAARDNGVFVWGKILADEQDFLGVEVAQPSAELREIVARASERLTEREASAAAAHRAVASAAA